MDKKRRCGILDGSTKKEVTAMNMEKTGRVSGVAAKGTGHDPAAGSGYIRCVQQNRQQVGVQRGAAGYRGAAGAGGTVWRHGGRHSGGGDAAARLRRRPLGGGAVSGTPQRPAVPHRVQRGGDAAGGMGGLPVYNMVMAVSVGLSNMSVVGLEHLPQQGHPAPAHSSAAHRCAPCGCSRPYSCWGCGAYWCPPMRCTAVWCGSFPGQS